MKRLLILIIAILAFVEVAYLAVVNVALNLPATQSYINQLRPERYEFQWERAWSWHPFRIHASGFSANGQTWSKQWQVTAPAITASLAILPLFDKTAHIYNLDTADIDVRFRPRPSPDRDDAAVRQYYPTIEGRDPNAAADPVPSETPGWKFVFDIAEISGENDVWVAQLKATLAGDGRGTVIHQSKHGPLTVSGAELNAELTSLTVDGEPVSENGSINGKFDFATFLPQENRGMKALAFMSLDADIDVPVEGLDFVNFYLTRVSGMTLAGKGSVKGHIAYDKGNLVAGSDLTIVAEGLTVDESPYAAEGAGEVAIKVDAARPDTLAADIYFNTLNATYGTDKTNLFTGNDLKIAVERSTRAVPGEKQEKVPRRVAVTIPKVTVADLSAYQHYLPDKWNVRILGGTGSLEGSAELSAGDMDFDLTLRSEEARVQLKDDAFETDLVMGVKARGATDATTARVDISGTYLDLDDSRVKTNRGDNSAPWQARLSIGKGDVEIDLPVQIEANAGFVGFWSLFHDRDLKGLLATANGQLQAALTISDLDWVNLLFKNPYSLAIYNSAEIEADLAVSSGWLATGSTVKMPPRDFRLEVLDYVAEGSGGFDLVVEKGGEAPDLRLDANLSNASLRLQDEKDAVIDQMTLAVTASAKGVSKNGGSVKTLDLSIPAAKVKDMAAFNAYLPKGSPVRILGGKADMNAKVNMREKTASGFVKMQTSRVEADIDGQRISGTIATDIKITGGSAQNKTFDIDGSSLQLDGVTLTGTHATNGNWSGRIDLGKGRVVWKKPMNLDVSAAVRMTDTRPLLALFEAHRKTHKWLDRILTLKDVRGNATIRVAPNEFVVPYALAKSDTIEVGVKGIIREQDREGIFYARYGRLAGILEIQNKERHFGLIGATRKFDEYVPGGKLPGMREAESSTPSAETKTSPFSIFKKK